MKSFNRTIEDISPPSNKSDLWINPKEDSLNYYNGGWKSLGKGTVTKKKVISNEGSLPVLRYTKSTIPDIDGHYVVRPPYVSGNPNRQLYFRDKKLKSYTQRFIVPFKDLTPYISDTGQTLYKYVVYLDKPDYIPRGCEAIIPRNTNGKFNRNDTVIFEINWDDKSKKTEVLVYNIHYGTWISPEYLNHIAFSVSWFGTVDINSITVDKVSARHPIMLTVHGGELVRASVVPDGEYYEPNSKCTMGFGDDKCLYSNITRVCKTLWLYTATGRIRNFLPIEPNKAKNHIRAPQGRRFYKQKKVQGTDKEIIDWNLSIYFRYKNTSTIPPEYLVSRRKKFVVNVIDTNILASRINNGTEPIRRYLVKNLMLAGPSVTWETFRRNVVIKRI